jgi:hypothetical protein
LRVKTAFITFLILKTSLFSQGLSVQTVLPGASVIYTEGIHYSQTIGETAIELFSSSDNDLTQGFQQPRMKMLPGTIPPGTGINTYPNPASDYINIEFYGESARSFRITVSNISGTMVYSSGVEFSDKYWYIHEIPVSTFSPGLYFVQVISKDGALRRSFKIEKL